MLLMMFSPSGLQHDLYPKTPQHPTNKVTLFGGWLIHVDQLIRSVTADKTFVIWVECCRILALKSLNNCATVAMESPFL